MDMRDIPLSRWYTILDNQAQDEYYCKRDHFDLCLLLMKLHGRCVSLHWRSARAAHMAVYQGDLAVYQGYQCCFDTEYGREALIGKCSEFAQKAYETDKTDPNVLKMLAISQWESAHEAMDTVEEVDLVNKCKETLDKAIKILPDDNELRQVRGKLYYKVASVKWVDKAFGFLAGASLLPKASLEMALDDLMEANRLQPDNKLTCLYIALVYLAKKQEDIAKEWVFTGIKARYHGLEGCTSCREFYKLAQENHWKINAWGSLGWLPKSGTITKIDPNVTFVCTSFLNLLN